MPPLPKTPPVDIIQLWKLPVELLPQTDAPLVDLQFLDVGKLGTRSSYRQAYDLALVRPLVRIVASRPAAAPATGTCMEAVVARLVD